MSMVEPNHVRNVKLVRKIKILKGKEIKKVKVKIPSCLVAVA